MSDDEFKSWLYSLDVADLHNVAADHRLDPADFESDDELIEAIIKSLRS